MLHNWFILVTLLEFSAIQIEVLKYLQVKITVLTVTKITKSIKNIKFCNSSFDLPKSVKLQKKETDFKWSNSCTSSRSQIMHART